MKKIKILATVAALMFIGQGFSQNTTKNDSKMETKEFLTFKLSDKVIKENVQYKNRYGITIAAHLYLPKNIDKAKKYTSLLVGTPYGGVKEQGAGIYSQNMAERGFVAMAFDESYNGESGGEPRHVSSTDIFVEDFSAGVDYLGTLSFVDRNKIGVIGICASGAFAITAAQTDHRIKAVATTSMVDMSRVKRELATGGTSLEQRNKYLDQISEQRWKDLDSGKMQIAFTYPSKPIDKVPDGLDPLTSEFYEYYAMKRGHHPNSIGGFTITSDMSFFNFPLMNDIETISPRPILFVVGDKAVSRFFSDDAFKRAAEPKEMYVVPNARHIDLYDRTDLIPFDKLESFFRQNLK
jgi:fermentation-respiration switch protein FrsA (DUF1100 family)